MNFQPLPQLFPDQQLWGAQEGVFTFVISKDEEGFTASVKVLRAQKHDLGGYCAHRSLDDAKAACLKFLKEKN